MHQPHNARALDSGATYYHLFVAVLELKILDIHSAGAQYVVSGFGIMLVGVYPFRTGLHEALLAMRPR